MKAEVKIPEGWRRLRWRAPIRLTDRVFDRQLLEWEKVSKHWEFEEGDTVQANEVIIRRAAKPAKKK